MDWSMFYVCQPTALNSIEAFIPYMYVCVLLKKADSKKRTSVLSYFTLD